MITVDQMGFGMNAAEMQQDKEYEKAIENFGQAHLAWQDTRNLDLQSLK